MHPTRAAATALVAALALAAPAAHAANLWIAWERTPGAAACRPVVEDMFACVLGATQEPSLATAYPGGRALTLAGSAMVSGCMGPDGLPDYACAIEQAGFDFRDGDVFEYLLPTAPAFAQGVNFPLTVTLGSRTVHGNGAWVLNPERIVDCGDTVQTAFHEAYEASSEQSAADCCTGEMPSQCPGCSPTCTAWHLDAGATPENSTLVCPSGTFRFQPVSPVSDEFHPESCTRLVVDATALCAQPRATRVAGHCTPGGDLATCELGTVVHSCGGSGCADAPSPHCDAPLAGWCTVEYPHVTYSGLTETVTVTCTNDGASAWPAGLAMVTAPDADSPLWSAGAGWSSARSPGVLAAGAVATGTSVNFSFTIQAPVVTSPTTVTQGFALRAPDGTALPFPAPAELALRIDVLPCHDDPDASTWPDPPDASWTDAGGGCALTYPGETCDTVVRVAGRCTNAGDAGWPAELYVAPEPPSDHPFGYSMGLWESPSRAATVLPPVRGACTDTRRFQMDLALPFAIGATTYAQGWSLVTADGGTSPSLPAFATSISVPSSCHDAGAPLDASPPRHDAGADAARRDAHADAAMDATDEGPQRATGCACRAAAGGDAGAPGGAIALGLAVGLAARRRRRRRSRA